jgi:hypothetical protein
MHPIDPEETFARVLAEGLLLHMKLPPRNTTRNYSCEETQRFRVAPTSLPIFRLAFS